MGRPTRTALICRPAFTLVEMIVVLALVLLLAALAVALAPRLAERQKTQRGADQLQGWFGVARQWARSARTRTGIRLLPGRLLPNPAAPNPSYVTELQYIQQPLDFVATPGLTPNDPVNVRRIQVTASSPGVFKTVVLEPAPAAVITPRPGDFSGGFGTQTNLWPVQVGDYFQANGGGLMHQITQVVDANTLVLGSSLPTAVGLTKQYRIVRRPRILPGEAALEIAQDVAIDLTRSQLPSANPDGSIDIVFNPSGSMIGGSNDKVILWVRDVTQDINNPGDQVLITIYIRTGLVAAFEVAPPPDPYLFTRGQTGGL
jgi:prepilin-type N-terminal cleavage/methylation domain-containing protein